jgi:hypothetical protein
MVKGFLMLVLAVLFVVVCLLVSGTIYNLYVQKRITNLLALPLLFVLGLIMMFLGSGLLVEDLTYLLSIRIIGSFCFGIGVVIGAIRSRQLVQKGMTQYRSGNIDEQQH